MAAAVSLSFADEPSRKRSNPDESDSDDPPAKSSRNSIVNYFVIAPEPEVPTDEDTETIYSIQSKPTDSAKDTSDTSVSDESSVIYTIGDHGVFRQKASSFLEEYEPASLSEQEPLLPDVLSTASDSDVAELITSIGYEYVNTDTDVQDESTWADTSSISSDTDSVGFDPELTFRDYWSCVQCKSTNNNPLFRYCEKCFKIRKNFFPLRPKGKKKKKMKMRKRRCRRNMRSSKPLASTEPHRSDTGYSSFVTTSLPIEQPECLSSNVPPSVASSSNLSESFVHPSSCSSSNLTESFVGGPSGSSVNDGSNQERLKSTDKLNNNVPSSSLCEMCMTSPKDGIFVHGRKFAHMYCCYQCSKKVWRSTGRCPLCNCKIMQVLKVIS